MIVIGSETVALYEAVSLRRDIVCLDHLTAKFFRGRAGLPPQTFFRSRRIPKQGLDLRRPKISGIHTDDDVAHGAHRPATRNRSDNADFLDTFTAKLDSDPELCGGHPDKVADAELPAGRDNKVLCDVLLQHQPLHLDIIARMTPVAQGAHVAEVET